MGLIHSRASKKRDKAVADLAEAQARQVREETRQLRGQRRQDEHDEAVERAGDNVLRQPTVSDAISAWRRNRRGGQ